MQRDRVFSAWKLSPRTTRWEKLHDATFWPELGVAEIPLRSTARIAFVWTTPVLSPLVWSAGAELCAQTIGVLPQMHIETQELRTSWMNGNLKHRPEGIQEALQALEPGEAFHIWWEAEAQLQNGTTVTNQALTSFERLGTQHWRTFWQDGQGRQTSGFD
ncbi:MAG: hypothetical protein ACO3JL_21155, partial [Myxococcota bacterium]